jgi:hypothetical protein
MRIDWDRFDRRTTFVLGSDKHAGKTTFLKYALACLRARGRCVAYLTVGVDGRPRDMLSGAPKPSIVARPGDYLVTTESSLAQTDASLELLEVFSGETVLGRPVLARVVRSGRVELVGPTDNRRLADILQYIHAETPADAVLVDGAVDRVTQVSAARRAGYVTVLRVGPATLRRCAGRIRLAVLLDNIPKAEGSPTGCRLLQGALTRGKLGRLPEEDTTLWIEDFTRVFLDHGEMANLCRRRTVRFRETFELMFFVVNLQGVGRDEFLQALGPKDVAERVVFNPYLA